MAKQQLTLTKEGNETSFQFYFPYLTATPKSQARWYGSQSTYSTVVTVVCHTSLPPREALHAH